MDNAAFEDVPASEAGTADGNRTYRGMSAGDFLRNSARRELGATMQKRWLD